MKRTEVASTRLSPEEKERLARIAELRDRSESWIIRKMILAGLRKQNLLGRHRKTASGAA